MVQKGHCLSNDQSIGVESTSVQNLVHVSIQVIELQKHACPILMYGPKLFYVFPKKEMFTQILLCIVSLHHQSLSPRQVLGVGLVRFANSTGRRRRR